MLTDEYDYNSDMQAKMEDATIRNSRRRCDDARK